MNRTTTSGTVHEHNGRIVIHLGSGSGEVTAPRGVTFEQAKEIACNRFPLGTPSRRQQILDALRAIAQETIEVHWRTKDLKHFLPMDGRTVDAELLCEAIAAALAKLHPADKHDVTHDNNSRDYTGAIRSAVYDSGDIDEQPIWNEVEKTIDMWAPIH